MEQNSLNNIIAVLTFVVIIIAFANLSVTLIKMENVQQQINGNIIRYGYVNVTITQNVQLNIYNETTYWGPGIVNPGCDRANLTTSQNTAYVQCGNWSTTNGKDGNPTTGMYIENMGNGNLTIDIISNKNVTDMYNSSSGINKFMWNFTDKDAGACTYNGTTPGEFFDVNKTTNLSVCADFGYAPYAHQMWIDTRLVLGADIPGTEITSPGGDRIATFTITGTPNGH